MDAPTIVRKRFTVSEYEQIAAAGLLGEGERFELLGGEIVEMAALGPQHSASVTRVTELFYALNNPHITIRVQDPVRLGDFSAPQPDISVVNRRDDRYAGGHPEPEDVLLLIEVSESSLPYDRDVKLPLYAAAGIAEVWLVALLPQVVEVYRAPSENGYGEKRTLRRGDTLSPLHLPEVVLRVDEMIGERI
jgi:Uma2 family endonuclease